MTFAANNENPKIEKHTLLIVKPRIRLTGFEVVSGSVFRAPWPHPYVISRAWKVYDEADGLDISAPNPPNNTSGYYDRAAGYFYVFSEDDLLAPENPDDYDFPGVTVEFELPLSDQAFTGPRDPLDADSEHVNWIPAMPSSPLAQIGSRETVYGFVPMGSSVIEILNHDAFLNPIAKDASFYRAPMKAYLLANSDLQAGAAYSEVREIFKGFATGFRAGEDKAFVTCTDFISFFDKRITMRKITDTSFGSAIEPRARVTNNEWFIPRVFGIHERFQPIAVDYDASPSETNNRIFVTHERDYALDGSNHDDGDLGYTVDHLAANTTNRTYFTTQPKVRAGDSMIIQRSGVPQYVFVTGVGANYVDHGADAIGTSVLAGDIATRYFIGTVHLKDQDGNVYTLKAGRDFTRLVDNTNNVRGFILADNLETTYGMLNTPYDPSTWEISCTLYGKKGLDAYEDASAVGAVVDKGGIAAQGISALYRLIVEAGIDQSEIAEGTFQAVQGTSYAMGVQIPPARNVTTETTYRDTINAILTSNLYKLAIMEEGTLKIGLVEVGPMASVEYRAGELNHKELEFEHDYAKVYSEIFLEYNRVNVVETDPFSTQQTEYASVIAESAAAFSLHFIKNGLEIQTLLVDPDEAEQLAQRFAFMLGERRGFWQISLEQPYTDKSNLGAVYELSRQKMPGAAYVEGTQRAQNLVVVEVNKNSGGVTMTLEDQKGVQDNAADWG